VPIKRNQHIFADCRRLWNSKRFLMAEKSPGIKDPVLLSQSRKRLVICMVQENPVNY
jgi:hypothetical protein